MKHRYASLFAIAPLFGAIDNYGRSYLSWRREVGLSNMKMLREATGQGQEKTQDFQFYGCNYRLVWHLVCGT
ncbi:hypothetical protein OROGR_032197 [Orobanche gracilis]